MTLLRKPKKFNLVHQTVSPCESGDETSSASAEREGLGEVSGITPRVTCTWWLLWMAVEMPWLALGGPILA